MVVPKLGGRKKVGIIRAERSAKGKKKAMNVGRSQKMNKRAGARKGTGRLVEKINRAYGSDLKKQLRRVRKKQMQK